MADNIQSFAVDCRGGMISNLSPLQQASQVPGSARSLVNFEPTIEGGYRRISGTSKIYDQNDVVIKQPNTRKYYLQTAATAGATSITIGNLPDTLFHTLEGDSFTLGGNTYTITNISLGGYGTNEATLTFTPALAANASSKALVNVLNTESSAFSIVGNKIIGSYPAIRELTKTYYVFSGYKVEAYSFTSDIYLKNGTSPQINGAGQTGTTFNIDGLDRRPIRGQTFMIDGIDKVYTVETINSYNEATGAAQITTYTALASSPSDNATITWLSFEWYPYAQINRATFDYVTINDETVFSYNNSLFVVGAYVKQYDQQYYTNMVGRPVAYHKNQLFLVDDSTNTINFSAPYSPYDFSPANGGGAIKVDATITNVKAFKDQLFIFCVDRILTLIGSTSADFQLQPVTLDIGCPYRNTVQQMGGDIIFLSQDGFRLLSATNTYGNFNLGSVSNSIKNEINFLLSAPDYYGQTEPFFVSVAIPEKNQYRIFRQAADANGEYLETYGLIGTQSSTQAGVIEWSILDGLDVGNITYAQKDMILFATSSGDPYIYQMDIGDTFDGTAIAATYSTPFFIFNDPKLRKTLTKLTVYCDKDVSTDDIEFTTNIVFDFNEAGVIQPSSIAMGNINASYGDTIGEVFETQLVGSGFSAAIEISCTTNVPSFSIDNFVIEYMLHDRR